jgi:hypothetical protein
MDDIVTEVPAQEQNAGIQPEVPTEVPAQEQAAVEAPAAIVEAPMPTSAFQTVGFGSAIQRNV